MAPGTRLLLRLALAALVSAAAAGLLMTVTIYFGATSLGFGWRGATAADLAVGLAAGLKAGLVVATLPAFLAGAAMWALGRRFVAARRAPAWAAAGAAAGALLWAALAAAIRILLGEPGLGRPDGVLVAAMLVGIGAALTFRAVARPQARRL